MQYDSPITSATFQSFLDSSTLSSSTTDAISALLNLDTAATVNVASWDGVSAPEGQANPDFVIADIAGAKGDLVSVDLPDSLSSAKAFVFDSDASIAVTFDAPAAQASLARVADVTTTATTDFGLVIATGAGDDVITVKGDQNTYIDGGNGNDTIITGNGNNTVVAGAGNNNVTTGTGNDTIVLSGTAHTDIVNAGAGYDVVQLDGSSDDYTFTAGASNNVTLTGGQTAVIADAEFLSFADGSTVALAHSEAEGTALRLYEGLLGRDADLDGAQAYTGFVDGGGSLTDVANLFLNSTEFKAPEDAAHIESLYTSILGHAADAQGLEDWQGYLANGGSLTAVASVIAVSAEAQTVDQSNGDFIQELYTNVLGRDAGAANPDADVWVAQLFNGASRADVAAAIVGSAEATAKTDGEFIDSLYQNALGRTADAAGKADWAGLLAAGGTHADVAIGIVGSPEAAAHSDNVVVLHGAV